MKRLAFCGVMMLSGCISSGPGTDPAAKAAYAAARDAYMECVFARAGAAARQQEPAETLAMAAAAACSAEDAAAFAALRTDAGDDRLALVAMDRLRIKTKEGALGVVVSRRSGQQPSAPRSPAGAKI